ncbi:MAG: 16S rRNA (uracil(1498)-N(3))-methyltransferase [Alphaproteobacteria bacterium]|nr:MAG: 16S rRNA (uracil(1498)-N(3))-methyltransferase [Alphaproteobacteria bacterium]
MAGTMKRLYVDAPLHGDALIEAGAEQVNYLLNVLRLSPGAQLLLFNGRDGEWLAEIAAAGKRRCSFRVLTPTRAQQDGPDIHYLFAPVKRARLDFMVEKATELGVAAIRPVMTRRTIVARVNMARMRANAIEAAEQCGILRIPEIHAPVKLEALLAEPDPARPIIYCDEEAPVASPLEALERLQRGTPVAVLIGPEGGFDPAERALLRGLEGVHPISLGPRVMRADTAAVAALALVNAVLGDWR